MANLQGPPHTACLPSKARPAAQRPGTQLKGLTAGIIPAGQGAHPQTGGSSHILALLYSLPSSHLLTHTLSPRSHTICFRLCTGCSSFLECPSYPAYLSNSFPSFKTSGQLLCEVLPQHLVCPHCSIMPTSASLAALQPFILQIFTEHLPCCRHRAGDGEAKPRPSSIRPGYGSASPYKPLPGGQTERGAREGPQEVMRPQLDI